MFYAIFRYWFGFTIKSLTCRVNYAAKRGYSTIALVSTLYKCNYEMDHVNWWLILPLILYKLFILALVGLISGKYNDIIGYLYTTNFPMTISVIYYFYSIGPFFGCLWHIQTYTFIYINTKEHLSSIQLNNTINSNKCTIFPFSRIKITIDESLKYLYSCHWLKWHHNVYKWRQGDGQNNASYYSNSFAVLVSYSVLFFE